MLDSWPPDSGLKTITNDEFVTLKSGPGGFLWLGLEVDEVTPL